MNCKQGDIARIVHPSMYGTLVLILYPAPFGVFELPNGQLAEGIAGDGWVFEFLGSEKPVPNCMGAHLRTTKYANASNKWLRPIGNPGQHGVDETLAWLPVPALNKVST